MLQLEDKPEECAVSKTTEKKLQVLGKMLFKSGFMELEKKRKMVERSGGV